MAAAAAEHWLGAPVNVMPTEQRLLQAGRSLWNLRQFDLARRTRGARAIGDWTRQTMSPAWRPVRIGFALLVALQIVGLNVWAWHQKSAVEVAPGRDPGARQEDLPARRRRRRPARPRRRHAARDAVAAHARRQGRRQPTSSRCCRRPPRPGRASGRRSRTVRYEAGKLTLAATGWSDAPDRAVPLGAASGRVQASEGADPDPAAAEARMSCRSLTRAARAALGPGEHARCA